MHGAFELGFSVNEVDAIDLADMWWTYDNYPGMFWSRTIRFIGPAGAVYKGDAVCVGFTNASQDDINSHRVTNAICLSFDGNLIKAQVPEGSDASVFRNSVKGKYLVYRKAN